MSKLGRGRGSAFSGAATIYFGLGLLGLGTLVFIELKLFGKIQWSSWRALSPLWIVASSAAGLVMMFAALVLWLGRLGRTDRRRARFAAAEAHGRR